jgi:hypothetical protein
MQTHVASVTDEQMSLAPTGAERLREGALGAFAALLGIVFLLLLAADQAHVVAGVF